MFEQKNQRSGKRISVQTKVSLSKESAFREKNQRSGKKISVHAKESAFMQKNQRSG
ncbi:hypothetical protein ABWW58_08155 [Sporolactobacillus sp. STCC-11]|uniref:hypothetical protein n=1 Tax=Sporolactobacillus caesalpiniae TaxID=3230362 RepID=UPI00339301F5